MEIKLTFEEAVRKHKEIAGEDYHQWLINTYDEIKKEVGAFKKLIYEVYLENYERRLKAIKKNKA